MANDRTITAANAVLTLSVASVFTSPVQIQGFAADDVFDVEDLDTAETQMGVDGRLSAGFVFNEVNWSISLQADSLSNDLFDQWYRAEQQLQEKLRATGVVVLTAVSKQWTLTRGVIKRWPPMPNAGKVLKPRKFGMTWERILPSPV